MNIKHQIQHITIDNPEFPMLYDGKEILAGRHSSFYTKTDKQYEVISIVKKYNERLKGKCKIALYFLYCREDDSYKVVERKEVENLTENFGFDYKNDYLDAAEVGEIIPSGTILNSSTSYDDNGNVSIGVNGRILFGTHPAVQDDAIIISESFAKRMISNQVSPKIIPINENTILLNLYGKNGEYQGLPNIGDTVTNGILAATRNVKETRMFSDLRDSSLSTINLQSDQVFYGDGEVIDINVYCNDPNIKSNKVNKQLIEYYNDAKWFYTEVYKNCAKIINSGCKNVDKEINRWKKKAMDYLDTQAIWAFNDNTFSNLMVEILIRKKEPIKIGRKIVGRSGNKTVTSSIWKDEDMPYLTEDAYRDEYGVVHPKGKMERVELISNPLALVTPLG
jgi:DNA-directed RNA polymerase beta subunit